MSFLTPPELLNLARTTTSFAQLLADPKSEFVWQQARANYYPVIPRPTASNWTESSYANLMFGGGECLVSYPQTSVAFIALTISFLSCLVLHRRSKAEGEGSCDSGLFCVSHVVV
jgi:hypothetical protein